MESKIVHIRIDDWFDMGEAHQYLNELLGGEHDNDVNYAEVWYDMASVFCITTTEEYAKTHNLMGHTTNIENDLFGEYFPEYNPEQFEIIGSADADVMPEGWRGMSQHFVDLYYAQENTGSYKKGNRLACLISSAGIAKVPYKRILIRPKKGSINQ